MFFADSLGVVHRVYTKGGRFIDSRNAPACTVNGFYIDYDKPFTIFPRTERGKIPDPICTDNYFDGQEIMRKNFGAIFSYYMEIPEND